MATISRFSAVASIGRLRFAGFFAWVLWLAIHLVYIIGFKHRVTTLLHWFVSFLGRGRAERVATEQQVFARRAMTPCRATRSRPSRPTLPTARSAGSPSSRTRAARPPDRRRRRGRRVTAMPLDYPIHRRTLPNGLRVVVSPDHTVPNVTSTSGSASARATRRPGAPGSPTSSST